VSIGIVRFRDIRRIDGVYRILGSVFGGPQRQEEKINPTLTPSFKLMINASNSHLLPTPKLQMS
jgi:hypothetical protein